MLVFHNYILYNYSFIIPRTVDNHVLSQYYYLDNKDLQLYICLLVGLVNNFKKEKKLNTRRAGFTRFEKMIHKRCSKSDPQLPKN